MGQLTVYLMVNDAPQSTLFNASGDHGDRWIMGQADFSSRTVFSLLFEGVRGTDHQGDIAIDDIIVNMGSCASQGTMASTTNAPITTASQFSCCFFIHNNKDITCFYFFIKILGNNIF